MNGHDDDEIHSQNDKVLKSFLMIINDFCQINHRFVVSSRSRRIISIVSRIVSYRNVFKCMTVGDGYCPAIERYLPIVFI